MSTKFPQKREKSREKSNEDPASGKRKKATNGAVRRKKKQSDQPKELDTATFDLNFENKNRTTLHRQRSKVYDEDRPKGQDAEKSHKYRGINLDADEAQTPSYGKPKMTLMKSYTMKTDQLQRASKNPKVMEEFPKANSQRVQEEVPNNKVKRIQFQMASDGGSSLENRLEGYGKMDEKYKEIDTPAAEFVTVAGVVSLGKNVRLNDGYARTGIDVMVTEGIKTNNFNLEKLPESVQDLLVEEFFEYEKMEMDAAGKEKLPVHSPYKIYERQKKVVPKEKTYTLDKPEKDASKHSCCRDKSLHEVAPVKIRRPDKIKFDKSDIDKVHYILNDYLLKDMQAKKNWRKVKFRLQVISQFQSLKEWILEPPDSDSEVDEEKKKSQLWYIIHSDGISKIIWDMFTNIVYVINFFMILYTIAFNIIPLELTWIVELIIDIIQFLDIIFEFVTTRYNNDGMKLESFSELAPLYLSGNFVFDLLSCLPGLITLEGSTEQYEKNLYYLKIFRLIQVGRCFGQVDNMINTLKNYYMQKAISISNAYTIVKTFLHLFMIFHIFACIWINLGNEKGGWRKELIGTYKQEDPVNIYCTAFYFVTTNATTIGYGDIYGTTQTERIFLMILEFIGILCFGSITAKIQAIKYPDKIENVIEEKISAIQDFMWQVDQTRQQKTLEEEIYDSTTKYMSVSYHYGVANSFTDAFYADLSVNLKNKLVFVVLRKYYERLDFFFNDRKFYNFADMNFVRKILVSLDCQIYYHNQTIFEVGKRFNALFFIYNNKVKVVETRKLFVIADLCPGSWFGDFDIFFQLTNQYQYLASAPQSANPEEDEEESTQIRILTCPAIKLLQALNQYPKIAQFMYRRALQRRNYFRLIEQTYNRTYNVTHKGYDFLRCAARKPDTKEFIKKAWQNNISKEKSQIRIDPFSLKDSRKFTNLALAVVEKRETIGAGPRNVTKEQAELQLTNLSTQINLNDSCRTLEQSMESLLQLNNNTNNGLFEPTSKLRINDDLSIREKVKVEIMNERIKTINKRRSICASEGEEEMDEEKQSLLAGTDTKQNSHQFSENISISSGGSFDQQKEDKMKIDGDFKLFEATKSDRSGAIAVKLEKVTENHKNLIERVTEEYKNLRGSLPQNEETNDLIFKFGMWLNEARSISENKDVDDLKESDKQFRKLIKTIEVKIIERMRQILSANNSFDQSAKPQLFEIPKDQKDKEFEKPLKEKSDLLGSEKSHVYSPTPTPQANIDIFDPAEEVLELRMEDMQQKMKEAKMKKFKQDQKLIQATEKELVYKAESVSIQNQALINQELAQFAEQALAYVVDSTNSNSPLRNRSHTQMAFRQKLSEEEEPIDDSPGRTPGRNTVNDFHRSSSDVGVKRHAPHNFYPGIHDSEGGKERESYSPPPSSQQHLSVSIPKLNLRKSNTPSLTHQFKPDNRPPSKISGEMSLDEDCVISHQQSDNEEDQRLIKVEEVEKEEEEEEQKKQPGGRESQLTNLFERTIPDGNMFDNEVKGLLEANKSKVTTMERPERTPTMMMEYSRAPTQIYEESQSIVELPPKGAKGGKKLGLPPRKKQHPVAIEKKEEPETGEVKAGQQQKKKISTIVKKNNKKRSTDQQQSKTD